MTPASGLLQFLFLKKRQWRLQELPDQRQYPRWRMAQTSRLPSIPVPVESWSTSNPYNTSFERQVTTAWVSRIPHHLSQHTSQSSISDYSIYHQGYSFLSTLQWSRPFQEYFRWQVAGDRLSESERKLVAFKLIRSSFATFLSSSISPCFWRTPYLPASGVGSATSTSTNCFPSKFVRHSSMCNHYLTLS